VEAGRVPDVVVRAGIRRALPALRRDLGRATGWMHDRVRLQALERFRAASATRARP
jgi:hypothetical protein